MHASFTTNTNETRIAILPVITDEFDHWLSQQATQRQAWVKQTQFKAKSGEYCLLPKADGGLDAVIIGLADEKDFRAFGALPSALPEGTYEIQGTTDLAQAALGWGLGYYEFAQYKQEPSPRVATLFLPNTLDAEKVSHQVNAICLGRDLINTPAEDMGPPQLEEAVKKVAKTFSASMHVIKGDKLLKENYPSVHAVGRASVREPRVIDLTWGKKDAPKVTLVGKGVCFDSGGYDLKNAQGMLLMKKDMGGSAMMLALAYLIMSHQLPVRLRLLIGAVENLVAGNAYKPGDIIKTRSGKTIEIGNTDAEGRVVLCDLLTEACTESPEVLINFATLTGAARIALGPDLPAMFAQQDETALAITESGKQVNDPVWQLPLVQSYREKLKSKFADLSNMADSPWGGSITAALFLQSFVDKEINWAHFDVPAWNFNTTPARPAGAEVFGVRAVFDYLSKKYAA